MGEVEEITDPVAVVISRGISTEDDHVGGKGRTVDGWRGLPTEGVVRIGGGDRAGKNERMTAAIGGFRPGNFVVKLEGEIAFAIQGEGDRFTLIVE